MYDRPTPAELLEAAAGYLRDTAIPALSSGDTAAGPAAAYQARVTANVLDIVRRQLLLGPASEAAELQRLNTLLQVPADATAEQTTLAALNQQLADRIAAGGLTLETPGLAEHLWTTTLDKVAVDQPNYSSYQRLVGGARGR